MPLLVIWLIESLCLTMALAYELIKVLPYGTFLTQRQKTMTRSDTAGAKGHFLFNNTAT